MAEFCHPEFGCDCSEDLSFDQDELKAILDACEQYENEFGLLVGPSGLLYLDGGVTVPKPSVFVERRDRGLSLLLKLRELVA